MNSTTMNKNKFTALIACLPLALCAQTTLFLNGTLHLGNGEKIENGHLLVANNTIAWIGAAGAALPKADSTVDASKLHLYPGFIAPATPVGLVEIESVRATVDMEETGDFNPNARAAIAFNTDSRILPTLVANGIVIAQSTPTGGVFSGTSAVMRLQAWNWEDAAILLEDGIHLNWPGKMKYNAATGKLVENETYQKNVESITGFLEAALAYQQTPAPHRKEKNLKLAAFNGCFDGNKRLYVHTNGAGNMLEVARLTKKLGVKNLVFVGAAEAHLIAEFLASNNIPLILNRVHATPSKADDMVHTTYIQPKILQEAGVLFCISNRGDMAAMGNRNLPFMAGTAVGFGLSYEAAVAAISGNTAKILGIDAQYGTLETGKSATFLVATGDLLDARTHQIQTVWLDGKPLVQQNWQEDLYHKYLKRYESQ